MYLLSILFKNASISRTIVFQVCKWCIIKENWGSFWYVINFWIWQNAIFRFQQFSELNCRNKVSHWSIFNLAISFTCCICHMRSSLSRYPVFSELATLKSCWVSWGSSRCSVWLEVSIFIPFISAMYLGIKIYMFFWTIFKLRYLSAWVSSLGMENLFLILFWNHSVFFQKYFLMRQ